MDTNKFLEGYLDFIKDEVLSLIGKHHRPANEVIIDDVDLRNLLKISRRTALEYRRKGIIPYYKIENKIFYILSEVISGIKQNGAKYA